MLGRWRIFIGCHHHAQFDATHVAAIAHINLAHLTRRWRWRQRRCHAAQHADAGLPDKYKEHHTNTHPNEGGKCWHGALVAYVKCDATRELSEALDDGCICHAATFTHCLQSEATTGAL